MQYSPETNLVSIGIPFYNSAEFIKDAIRSVFAQTYKQWELILIDDGSSDDSLSIANSIQDSRVRVISDGKHVGLVGRLNQIIELSRGEYIARMDADDLMHPRRIELQACYLREHPQLDAAGSAMYSLARDYSVIGRRGAESSAKKNVPVK
ncbi:MAG: glycosyltransferase family A protein, partial [Candidatus Omnitrophota bacterium]